MKTISRAVALSLSLSMLPVVALATDDDPQPVQPTEAAPTWVPPPPVQDDWTTEAQAPVQQAPAPQAAPAGQWVYTSQYGWVWMPYGNSYTYLPTNGGTPNMYVYYPAVGWSWVVAPWVWGWGAMPWFGYAGWGGYPWYGYGYGTWYGYAGHYAHAGWYGGSYYHGGHWNHVGPGYRPPPRPGYGTGAPPPRPAPGAPRGVGAPPAGRMNAVPGRSMGAPSRGYASPGRPAGAPMSYAPGRGSAPGRAYAAGGPSFSPRIPSVAAPRGGFGGWSGGGHAGGNGGGGHALAAAVAGTAAGDAEAEGRPRRAGRLLARAAPRCDGHGGRARESNPPAAPLSTTHRF